ncbi:MAG TPA: response regulator, partial [Anaerolinea sp.]|nr:response regulator [Anaerolinea sp.]
MANASVLIIDDDRSIVRLCQRLLERATYEVFASTDPMEALKILEGRKVDLLLADIRMPVMDGFELIERARGIQPDLAVLVMTGFGTVDTAVQALYKGVDGLILKPFENTADLVQAVQRVLIDSRQKQDAARLQAFRPLFDISETLVSETSLKALEKLILDNIGSIFNAQYMCVYVASSGKGEPKLQMARNIPDPVATHAWAQVLRYALKCQTSEVVPAGETADGPVRAALRSLGWSSLMIGPIVRSGQVFTFLAGRDARQQGFSESDLELFAILSRQSVVAMENARLYTDLKDYVRRVEESQRALIQAEKMAAVGRLMASLAHEINNPLQS